MLRLILLLSSCYVVECIVLVLTMKRSPGYLSLEATLNICSNINMLILPLIPYPMVVVPLPVRHCGWVLPLSQKQVIPM